jgi:CDGSH-type Zn-finger protein
MRDGVKIKVSKDGPYLVSGEVSIAEQAIGTDGDGNSIKWIEGRKFSCKNACALCRCGHSSNKPFCSGKHAEIGFKGEETADNIPYEKKAEITKGEGLILKDVPILCAGARFCDPCGGTWTLTEESADAEKKKIAIEQACNCPSGRLTACEDGKNIEPKFEQSIGVVEDPEAGVSGPLWIRGGIQIESARGENYEIRNRITLCRCGKSKNKPFCDASHMTTGFSDK